jgi:hypothetical protein
MTMLVVNLLYTQFKTQFSGPASAHPLSLVQFSSAQLDTNLARVLSSTCGRAGWPRKLKSLPVVVSVATPSTTLERGPAGLAVTRQQQQ